MSWLSGFSTLQAALEDTLRPSFELLVEGMRPAEQGRGTRGETAEKA